MACRQINSDLSHLRTLLPERQAPMLLSSCMPFSPASLGTPHPSILTGYPELYHCLLQYVSALPMGLTWHFTPFHTYRSSRTASHHCLNAHKRENHPWHAAGYPHIWKSQLAPIPLPALQSYMYKKKCRWHTAHLPQVSTPKLWSAFLFPIAQLAHIALNQKQPAQMSTVCMQT